MSGKRHSRKHTDGEKPPPENDVHRAMRSLGWAMPESEADVRRAEEDLDANPVSLPDALADPKAVFEREHRPDSTIPMRLPFSGSSYIDATLARAAREGGEITPEVEDAMRRDRKAAERDAQDETNHTDQ